jgi:hypothetical protein
MVMLFERIGIHGWQKIEPVVLAAAVSDLSVLLVGDIGSNKTEGARAIAEAVLGPETQFRAYEVPTLNFDDLIGFINPKTLGSGHLEFVPTPFSIWTADAALFDEINRANPFIQSKLHELIRCRSLMGMPTNLKLIFSAVNPPERYQSGYMDLALASRFACVQVPGITEINETQLVLILSGNGATGEKARIKEVVQKARGCVFREHDLFVMQQLCKKVIKELSHTEIVFNARQTKMMLGLLKAGLALKSAANKDYFSNVDTNTELIASVIPDLHGVVRASVDVGMVKGTIRTVVSGFSLGDPLIMASSLEELCQIEPDDNLAWVTAVKEMTTGEQNIKSLEKAARTVKGRVNRGYLEKELGEKLMRLIATRLLTKTLIREKVPVVHIRDRATEVAAKLSAMPAK